MEKLTLEQLKKLSTGRLLSYKRSINHLAYADTEDGFFDCSCSGCKDVRATREEWKPVLNNIKKVLSTREHVEKKGPSHVLTLAEKEARYKARWKRKEIEKNILRARKKREREQQKIQSL